MNNKLPLGLAKPWRWEQPRDDDELLARLHDGFSLAVHERERENLCSVAYGRIKAMRKEIYDLQKTVSHMYAEAHRDGINRE